MRFELCNLTKVINAEKFVKIQIHADFRCKLITYAINCLPASATIKSLVYSLDFAHFQWICLNSSGSMLCDAKRNCTLNEQTSKLHLNEQIKSVSTVVNLSHAICVSKLLLFCFSPFEHVQQFICYANNAKWMNAAAGAAEICQSLKMHENHEKKGE